LALVEQCRVVSAQSKIRIFGRRLGNENREKFEGRREERGVKLAELHAETWQQELTSFAYLDESALVSRSVLSGGRTILVNRGPNEVVIDGTSLPGRTYAVAD
jgi:hypothetical protein